MVPIPMPFLPEAQPSVHFGGLRWWVVAMKDDVGWVVCGPMQSSRERAIEAWNELAIKLAPCIKPGDRK